MGEVSPGDLLVYGDNQVAVALSPSLRGGEGGSWWTPVEREEHEALREVVREVDRQRDSQYCLGLFRQVEQKIEAARERLEAEGDGVLAPTVDALHLLWLAVGVLEEITGEASCCELRKVEP